MPPKTKREMSMRILDMREVFMTPSLPYKQYITDHGEHPVRGGVGLGDHFYARYEFPYQEIKVSLIHGPMFNCDLDRPYEWRVSTPWNEEPEDYKTEEELYILLTKILEGVM